MTRNRAILAATSIAAAAALLVAGCDSDQPADPSPEPTQTSASPETPASPTPSPTPTVKAPERPKAMDDDGPAGAEAAAVYFLELDDYIMKTGDTAEWEAMSLKSCDRCSARLEQAQGIANRGEAWKGGEIRAQVLHTYEQDLATGVWPVDVEVKVAPVELTDKDGKVVFSEGANRAKSRIEMTRQDNRWVVLGVGDIPGS
ncbi:MULTISPECIES: DUF6318 family protein [unclassified Isoptericola]|uniref:DUF6318 family protein n=1 Tax=unclassified Isoptericola TaxID=2623355 RepID=UPI00364AE118